MKVIFFALAICLAFANVHPVNDDIVSVIKSTAKWIPMEPSENPFAYMPVEQIKAMMGTKLEIYEDTAEDLGFAPDDSFDARTKWPGKVHKIRDQGKCGSCWAFGATEALSDRFAIEQSVDVVLSPQHLVSCDKDNFGCQGGYLIKAWEFMYATGVLTDSCYPYTSGDSGDTGTCDSLSCQDGSERVLYHSGSYKGTGSVAKTKQAIQRDGPVEAAFTVYEDFMSYKSGVYHHTTGKMLGGHAIKAIGWGNEDGMDYWIMANSWGPEWGERGFFKIKMGDCGINSQMTYGSAGKVKSITQ